MSACSVIMVSYHTGPVLMQAVAVVLAEHGLKELIVIDNGNDPETVNQLRQKNVTLITGHGNVGFARGCNLGAAQATGEFLLLLNPDCLLPAGALSATMDALATYPGAVLAGCHLLNLDGTEQRGGRRELLTPQTALAEVLGKGKRLNLCDTPMPSSTFEVPAISGAFMAIRRSDYTRLNGLDSGYFLHVEDLDFCKRVSDAGGKIICVPHVKVPHFRSTSDVSSAFIERHKARGFLRYFRTHFAKNTNPLLLWGLYAGILARCALNIVRGFFINRHREEA